MIEKPAVELKFVQTSDPLSTVEVDIDSIPERYYGYSSLVTHALESFAAQHPDCRSTFYVYQGQSVNFHSSTFSAFIGVAGNEKDKLLDLLLKSFKRVTGVKARLSDAINPASGICEFHIEDGHVWNPADAITWYANELTNDSTPEAQYESDSDIETRNSNPSRYRAARSDTTIAVIKHKIEKTFGLPEGSVALCAPDGKALRSDAKIGTLRERWE